MDDNPRDRYVEKLIKEMREWRKGHDANAFYQFLEKMNIGWSIFKQLKEEYVRLDNEWEVTLSCLARKWLEIGIKSPKMPPHVEKLMMRYLRYYDRQTMDDELNAKREIEKDRARIIAQYVSEDYSKEQLDEPYATLFKSATKN